MSSVGAERTFILSPTLNQIGSIKQHVKQIYLSSNISRPKHYSKKKTKQNKTKQNETC